MIGCEHCDGKVPHFHRDGSGVVFTDVGAGVIVSPYHLGWGPLTDHDDDLPGAEYRTPRSSVVERP